MIKERERETERRDRGRKRTKAEKGRDIQPKRWSHREPETPETWSARDSDVDRGRDRGAGDRGTSEYPRENGSRVLRDGRKQGARG